MRLATIGAVLTLFCWCVTNLAAQHGRGGARERYADGRVPYQGERFDFTGEWEVPWHKGTAILTLNKDIKYHHWYYPEGTGSFTDNNGRKFQVKWRVPNTDTWEDFRLVLYILGWDHDNPFGRPDLRIEAFMITPGNNDYIAGTHQWRERVYGFAAKRRSGPQAEAKVVPPPDEREWLTKAGQK